MRDLMGGADCMVIPADPHGRRAQRRLASGLLALSGAVMVLGLLFGGTKVAGVDLPGWVGVAAGAALTAPSTMMLRWSHRAAHAPALSTEGDTLVVTAHAGPALRVRRRDIRTVAPVRPTRGAVESTAFGSHLFHIRCDVEVASGVRDIPVGARYVAADLTHVQRLVADWVRGDGDPASAPPSRHP